MITHFKKLKRCIRISAFLTPILTFIAFLLYALGWEGSAMLLGLAAYMCFLAFPHQKQKEARDELSWKSLLRIDIIPVIFFCLWLFSHPAYFDFTEQILSSNLWDWRLITAVAIWHILWIKSNYQKANTIKDEEIVDIYSESTP